MPKSPKRILIYRLGSLGDTLIALPALHLVARAFPDAERRMLTNFPVASKAPPAAAILDHTGLVHGFLRYAVGTRSPRELLAIWWQIVRFRPEVLVYIGSTRGSASARRDATFFRICGIFRQIGVSVTEDMQQPRRIDDSITGETYLEPEASRLVRNLAELGEAHLDDPASWDLHLTEAEKTRAVEVLQPTQGHPILAVSVGTKVQSKDWGRENWQALLSKIATLYPTHALALCGAPEEAEVSAFAAANWLSAPVVNLCGKLTPRESAAVFAHAQLFLGLDSGPMHLAASVGISCVAIFAARNIPRVWFPYVNRHRVLYHHVDCEGCGLETCIIEKKKCLTSITVDEVLAQVTAALPASQASIEVR